MATPKEFYASLSIADRRRCHFAYKEYIAAEGYDPLLRSIIFSMSLSVPLTKDLAIAYLSFS